MAAFTERAISWRDLSRGNGQRQPVHAAPALLAVGPHHLAHARGVGGRPVRAAALQPCGHRRAGIGKPSLAPMNTTTASGSVLSTCLADSLPQSSRSVFEMPVPTCASRTVRIVVAGQSPRQLGVQRLGQRVAGHQHRVQLARALRLGAQLHGVECRRRHRSAARPRSGRRGRRGLGEAATAVQVVVGREPGSGVVGRRLQRQPVRRPSRSACPRPAPPSAGSPGSICSPALRTEPPASRIRIRIAPSTTSTPSRAGSLRPGGASGTSVLALARHQNWK